MALFGRRTAVLVDLSGTIHVGDTPTPGAVDALQKLRDNRLKIKFVTNTTKEDVSSLLHRLVNMGFKIHKNEMYSSLIAARDHVRKLKCRPYLMLSEDAKRDFAEFDTENPNAVVVGLSPEHFQYDFMNKAFNMVLNGCPLIAIHKARYYKAPEGLCLGPGGFVEALEYATGSKACVVGKPEKDFFTGAAESLGSSAQDCVMIGDDARDDVIGAINAGMKGILVKTGKYRPGDETLIKDPAIVTENFTEAVNFLCSSIDAESSKGK